jgi:hypothetical protein
MTTAETLLIMWPSYNIALKIKNTLFISNLMATQRKEERAQEVSLAHNLPLWQPSTVATLKEKCATLGPREGVRQMKASGGSVTMVKSSAQMPRGVSQTKYIRKTMRSAHQQFGGENTDEVLAVLFHMKGEDEG